MASLGRRGEEEKYGRGLDYGVAQRTGSVLAGTGTHHLPSSGTLQVAEETSCSASSVCAPYEDEEKWFEYWRGGPKEDDFGVLYT